MRPDRGIVKNAITDAKGNLTGAAIILGCSRPTLYTWIYQLGLEKHAGIRIDNSDGLYKRDRKDTSPNKTEKQLSRVLTHGQEGRPILRAVSSTVAAPEIPVQASMRLPEGLWKRVKIEAIRRGVNVSDLVREVLEAALDESERGSKRKRGGTE